MPALKRPVSARQQVKRLQHQVRDLSTTLAAGELGASRLVYLTQTQGEKPPVTAFNEVITKCRSWSKESHFVGLWLALKSSVCNYGFQLRSGDKEEQEKLNEWLAADAPPAVTEYTDTATGEVVEVFSTATNLEMVMKFVEQAWRDRLLFNNVIAFWSDDNKNALTLAPERCEYKDTLGIEVLRYTHGLTQDQVEALPESLKQAFKELAVFVSPKLGMKFKVFKDSEIGTGFATPSLYSIFRLLGEVESKEFGANALAFASRSVKRAHILGHEITNGAHAGKPLHFWKKPWSDSVKVLWRDLQGFEDYTCRHDEKFQILAPDPKLFDDMIWNGSDRRLRQWGGPIMEMLNGSSPSAFLPNLLKAEIVEMRQKFGIYIAQVIRLAFTPPVKTLNVQWSNTIFNEARLGAEMLKFGVQYGMVSNRSATEEMGFNPNVESDRRIQELDDTNADRLLVPSFDAAHGTSPAMKGVPDPAADKLKAAEAVAKGPIAGTVPGRKPGTKNLK